jgi:hypothetical protein
MMLLHGCGVEEENRIAENVNTNAKRMNFMYFVKKKQ